MVNLLTQQTLAGSKPVLNVSKSVTSPRLFACFERFELAFFLVDSTSFTETTQFITRKWEVVDSEWFEHVRGLLEKSMAAPKSLEKLFAVGDLYDRARAEWVRFFHTGRGGARGGDPGGGGEFRIGREGQELTEADMIEIVSTEQRVVEFWKSHGVEPETDIWTAAERREAAAGIESPTPATAPKREIREIGIPANGAEIPTVGTVIQLTRRIESFGGFIPPGPATITAAGVDHFGEVFVSLSRGGMVVANLVSWPIE